MKYCRRLLLLFTIIFHLAQIECAGVPVLIWGNSKLATSIPHSIPALWTMSSGQFEKTLYDHLGGAKLVIFVQDELSPEDFSQNENSLTSLSTLAKNNIMFFQAVNNPTSFIKALPDKGYTPKYHAIEQSDVKSNSFIIEPKFDSNTYSNATVIWLPPTTSSSGRSAPLKITDAAIKKIVREMEKKGDFTYIFTAFHPVKRIEKAVDSVLSRKRRSVNAVQSQFFKNDCVLLYLKKNLLYVTPTENFVLPTGKINQQVKGDCSATNASIQLSYSGVESLGDVLLTFKFEMKSTKRWRISSAEIKAASNKAMILNPPTWLSNMRKNQSYACNSKFAFTAIPDDNGKMTGRLQIDGLQVQAFTDKASKFGMAVDCIGFFSLPIWAGLLIGILLILILFGGFSMMASLKTMDSFDDPKAKPLVAQNVD